MRFGFRTLLSAAFILAGCSLCLAEQIDNPQYVKWSKFKPGTSVTITSETDMAGTKTSSDITTTLVDLNAEKVVVEMKMAMTVNGTKMDMPARKTDIPAKIEKPPAPPVDPTTPKVDVKESTDSVTVAGTTYKCKVTEVAATTNGINSITKSWMCENIPGGLVKSETTVPDGPMKGTTKMTATAVTIK